MLGLKYKLLVKLLIITIIPIIATGIVIYYYNSLIITKTTIDNLESISNLQKKRISELIDRNYDRITTLADNNQILSLIETLHSENSTAKKVELDSFLNETKSTNNQYVDISILDTNGKALSSTDPYLEDKLFFNSGVYTTGKSSRYLDLGLNQVNKPVLFLTTPIIENKTIVGTLVVEVDPSQLFGILDDYTGLGKTGELVLARNDQHGNVMIISPTRSDPQSAFKIVARDPLDEPLIRAVYGQQSDFVNAVDYEGNKVLAVTSYFPSTQWGLVVKIDSNEAFANIGNVRNTILISTGAMILASVLASLILSKMISKPINKLRLFCNEVAKGKLDQKLDLLSTEPEYRNLTVDINHMISELEKLEKSKNEFISMISHELKSPIQPIVGYCDMLSDPNLLGELNQSQSEALSIIYQNSLRLRQLIDDLLATQSLELKTLKFNKREMRVNDIMKNVESLNKIFMKSKNIELVNSTKDDITFTGDPDRIFQIFANLIRNAIDFVGQKGRIEIGAKSSDSQVVFYVKDNGIGIPKDKQRNLFRKFYQVDTSLKRSHGGTGLGLSICKGLAEGMGGRIWLESEEDKGTSVYFSLPLD